jgi:hypothetical protein
MKHLFKNLIFVSAFSMAALFLVPQAHAATNIVSGSQWAWNDVIGWIDMQFTENLNVTVADDKLGGYANSSMGYIALNCLTGLGDSCALGNWKVLNDGTGNLSGWAWSDAIGWISFNSTTGGGSVAYGVNIDSTGDFSGWAWNDVVGWISFNCANIGGSCVASDYKVKTTWSPSGGGEINNWLISSTFDTCPLGTDCGVALNTIMWKGSSLDGSRVKFQIATDCVSGTLPACDTWNFLGPDGASSFYQTNWDDPIQINQLNHLNKRYFRYKIFLDSSSGTTPVVNDVIINWSP